MAGFGPVGHLPVAAVPAGAPGIVYTITTGNADAAGGTYTFTYTFPATRATWIGAEVLHTGDAKARATWIGAEVVHTGMVNTPARVTWIGVEVVCSIASAPVSDDEGTLCILW